jgi:hypothetical protein
MANAVNFVIFCKDPSVQAMTITWDELDCIYVEPSLQNETPPFHIPDLVSDDFHNILQGNGDPESAKSRFPRLTGPDQTVRYGYESENHNSE